MLKGDDIVRKVCAACFTDGKFPEDLVREIAGHYTKPISREAIRRELHGYVLEQSLKREIPSKYKTGGYIDDEAIETWIKEFVDEMEKIHFKKVPFFEEQYIGKEESQVKRIRTWNDFWKVFQDAVSVNQFCCHAAKFILDKKGFQPDPKKKQDFSYVA